MNTQLTLAGVALSAAAVLVGCSTVTDGRATCPGCGTAAEPAMPTARPPVHTPTAAPPPTQIVPAPPPSAVPAPPTGAEQLPVSESGYTYLETKSGKTRCQLNTETVGCESQFESAPEVDGSPANGVTVTADGGLNWTLGNLGAIPAVTLDYRTYAAQGWTIAADASGTRFTNDATGHGMFVAVQGVQSF